MVNNNSIKINKVRNVMLSFKNIFQFLMFTCLILFMASTVLDTFSSVDYGSLNAKEIQLEKGYADHYVIRDSNGETITDLPYVLSYTNSHFSNKITVTFVNDDNNIEKLYLKNDGVSIEELVQKENTTSYLDYLWYRNTTTISGKIKIVSLIATIVSTLILFVLIALIPEN